MQHGRRWGRASLFPLVGWLLVSLIQASDTWSGRKKISGDRGLRRRCAAAADEW
jgi:hypothetical protein